MSDRNQMPRTGSTSNEGRFNTDRCNVRAEVNGQAGKCRFSSLGRVITQAWARKARDQVHLTRVDKQTRTECLRPGQGDHYT